MKTKIIALTILTLFASITYAQTKADTTKLNLSKRKFEDTRAQIITLQSELYVKEKQLERLYQDFNMYNNEIASQKELIETKTSKEIKK